MGVNQEVASFRDERAEHHGADERSAAHYLVERLRSLGSARQYAAARADLQPFLRSGLLRERNKVRAMVRAAHRPLT